MLTAISVSPKPPTRRDGQQPLLLEPGFTLSSGNLPQLPVAHLWLRQVRGA